MSSTAAQKNILAAKEKGNACVQRGDYQQAIVEYTKGIDSTPEAARTAANSFHFLLGNRSLCYFELEEYQDAYDDANRALDVNERYSKGWFRLGLADRELNNDCLHTASLFARSIELDPTVEGECMKHIDALNATHCSAIFLEMLSINNTFSLLRQVWLDCGFRQKVKDHPLSKQNRLRASNEPFKKHLLSVCRALTPDSGASISELLMGAATGRRNDDVLYIYAVLSEWNNIDSVATLIDEIDSTFSTLSTGFDVVREVIDLIHDRIQTFAKEQKAPINPSDPIGATIVHWFMNQVCYDEDEHLIGEPSKLNLAVARKHFANFQFVASISGRLFPTIGRLDDPGRVAFFRLQELSKSMMPSKNRNVAIRTTQILIFKILLPFIENWMNEIYSTEEKRAELPKNIVDHFFNYKKIHPAASSLQSLLQDDGGVCACCLEPFVADKKTKSHYEPVECSGCGSVFFCSDACRDKAANVYGHNPKEKKHVACTGTVSDVVHSWRDDCYNHKNARLVVKRENRGSNAPTSSDTQPTPAKHQRRVRELIPNSVICTPANVQKHFNMAKGGRKLPNYDKWVSILKLSTDLKINNNDPYGDGDQSLVPGTMFGTPGGDLHQCWSSEMDFEDGGDVSDFMMWCYEGFFGAISAALAALANDEARRKAVNRRETLMRFSPLIALANGSCRMDVETEGTGVVHFLRSAKLLIDCGADVNARDILGTSVASWFCNPSAPPKTLSFLVNLCDTYPDKILVDTHNRIGTWGITLSCKVIQRFDTFKTLMMLGANPFRLDRNTGFLGIDPRFVNPKFHEIAMKCYRNRHLRLDDLVSLHSLKNAKHLNGVIGKIVERLPEGKYAVEITDDTGKQSKKKVSMENVIAAGECPNCDKPALLNELLCSTCRLGFCCQECLKSHDWCEDAEDSTHLQVSEECFISFRLEDGYQNTTTTMPLPDVLPVASAVKPRPNRFFLLKVDVPIKGCDMRELKSYSDGVEKYTFKPPEKNVFLYDATHTFKYVLDKEKQKRLGGAAQAQAYDALLAATDEYPAAFFWAVLDETESQIKIDIKAKTPTVLW